MGAYRNSLCWNWAYKKHDFYLVRNLSVMQETRRYSINLCFYYSLVFYTFFQLKKDIRWWKLRIHLWDSESLINIQIVPDRTPRFLELTTEGLESKTMDTVYTFCQSWQKENGANNPRLLQKKKKRNIVNKLLGFWTQVSKLSDIFTLNHIRTLYL